MAPNRRRRGGPVDSNRDGIPDSRGAVPPTPDQQLQKYRDRNARRKARDRSKQRQKNRARQGGPDNDRERVRERNPGTNVPESPGERRRRRRRGGTGGGPGSPSPRQRRRGTTPQPNPRTSPSATAARGSSGGGSSGGGGGSVGNTTVTRNVPGGGGGGGASTPAGSSGAAPTTPGASPTYKPFDVASYYAPAVDQVARLRAASDATRQNQLDNLGKINEWYMNAQGQGQTAVQDALARSQAQAQQATTDATNRTSEYLTRAVQGVEGNADLMRSAGISTAINQNAANEQNAAQDAAFNQRQNAALAERQNAERDVWAARVANLRSAVDANHLQRALGLDQQETALRTEMGKADLAERQRVQNLNESATQAARQAVIDENMANFTMGIKTGELDVKRYNAETERLTAVQRAKVDAATLRIKQQGLSLQEQKLQLQTWVEKQRVSDKEKDRLLKVGLAKLGGGGTGTGARGADAQTYMDQVETNFGKPLNQLNRHDYGQVAHGMLNWLSGKYPNLSRVQAARILRSYFDQSVTTDPRIKQQLRALFGG